MTLRSKLLLAQIPLALALLVTSYLALHTNQLLGRSSRTVLKDNFRSILAAQRIKSAVDRLDAAVVTRLTGEAATPEPARATLEKQLEADLETQESNITEEGEAEATRRLRSSWQRFRATLHQLSGGPGDRALYALQLGPALRGVRAGADDVLMLNEDAMMAKNDRVQRTASRNDALLLLATLGACLAGLFASGALTSRLLRPLGILSQAVRRLGQGDLDVRIHLEGLDEISGLAREFNAMADGLARYRQSSLGELLEAQQAAQAAIDSLPDPVVVFDVKGGLLSVNEPAERLLGVSLEKGLPTAKDRAPVTEALQQVRGHVLSGKGAYAPARYDDAFRTLTPEGERYFLPRGSAVYGTEGAINGVTAVLQDVTRLRLFDELTHDLVATVAHEFRTPLTSLRMAIHLCLEEVAGPITPKQADLLYAAREDCERLQGMVDDLLNVARLQSGRMALARRDLPVEALVPGLITLHEGDARSRGVALRFEPAPQGLKVAVDLARLELVFNNLLANALHYTPEGGAVEVRVRQLPREVRFEVTDFGPGIPPEYRERVFDKFFQVPGAPSGGAGLGLHIAQEIVRAHGGEMGVTSEIGKGSTFWFSLPLVEGTVEPGAPGS